MKRRKCFTAQFVILICMFFLFVAPPVNSADEASSVMAIRAVKNLMEAGDYEAAYNSITPIYAQDKGNRIGFMAGLCAYHTGRYDEAATIFKSILADEPENKRVRLELARAYAMAGEKQLARKEFMIVKAQNPPVIVGQNIDRFLDFIEGRTPGASKHDWLLQLSAGFVYDSNANGGPDTDFVRLYGDFITNDDTEKADSADEERVYFGHVYSLTDDFGWQSNISFYHRGYHDHHDYNADVFNVSTGPTLRLGEAVLSLPVLYERYDIGSDKYTETLSTAPQLRYGITDNLDFNLVLRAMKREYKRRVDNGRDSNIYSVESFMQYNFVNDHFIKFGGIYGKEKTDRDYYDNRFGGVYLGAFANLPYDFSIYLQQNLGWEDYDKAHTGVFTRERKDTIFKTYANLNKDFGDSGWSISMAYAHTFDKSNLTFYRYRRHQTMLYLSKLF